MNAITISLFAFSIVFGGALFGMMLRALLPAQHLSSETKDVVKLGMGLVGTVVALVLGLLVASAKASYDTQNNELTEMSAKIVLLDRVLAHYGPETGDERALLRKFVIQALDHMWSYESGSKGPDVGNERLYDQVQELTPKDDIQRSLQVQASNLIIELAKTRWLMTTQMAGSVSVTLLAMLIFWLTIIFISFAVFAPRNAVVIVSLFFSALAISGSILLILEMSAPYTGLIKISQAPLRTALSHLGE